MITGTRYEYATSSATPRRSFRWPDAAGRHVSSVQNPIASTTRSRVPEASTARSIPSMVGGSVAAEENRCHRLIVGRVRVALILRGHRGRVGPGGAEELAAVLMRIERERTVAAARQHTDRPLAGARIVRPRARYRRVEDEQARVEDVRHLDAGRAGGAGV